MAGGNKRLDEMAQAEAEPAPDFFGADDEAPAWNGGKTPRLTQPCPVTPLGVLGKQLIFLDSLQQIVMEPPRSCSKGELALWFGDDYLIEYFPHHPKGWKKGDLVKDFNQTEAQMALVHDCKIKNIFNPQGKVLGRGAHRPRADEGLLVLHMGRRVMIANTVTGKVTREPAGMIRIGEKDMFFPAHDSLPPPSDHTSVCQDGQDVLDLFTKWNFIDRSAPLLLLGWVAQAFICGAMEWRAHVWLPGPTATGKSSLQKIIRAMLDEWCVETADASEAAIRQILGEDVLAVSIDEAEAHDNPERLQAVLNLMKKGSTGDKILRGSADHKAQSFTAKSCFLLSSVLHAPLRGEDRNRIVLLDMRALPEDVAPLEMELARWRSVGRKMHRRMIEQWPRFERTLAAYKRAIGAQRYTGRWQDTYGVLLACADMLLYDLAPEAADDSMLEPGMSRVHDAIAKILPLLSKSRGEARTDVERVVQHLTSFPLSGAHGKAPEPVGAWLERAMTAKLEKGEFPTDPYSSGPDDEARNKLKGHGMKVVRLIDRPGKDPAVADALLDEAGWRDGYLAVGYATNKGMSDIFTRTEWAGGAWLQSFKKIEGCISPKKIRFAGSMPDNALLVPLSAFQGDEG